MAQQPSDRRNAPRSHGDGAVDLARLKRCGAGIVVEEGVRIFSGNDAERVGLERDLLARYHDYKETFRRMHETRLRRTAERGL